MQVQFLDGMNGKNDSKDLDREVKPGKREQPASFSACGLPGGLFGID
jgi:hypothetical protein